MTDMDELKAKAEAALELGEPFTNMKLARVVLALIAGNERLERIARASRRFWEECSFDYTGPMAAYEEWAATMTDHVHPEGFSCGCAYAERLEREKASLREQLKAAQQETASVRAWAGDALQQWENKYEQFIRGHVGCKERAEAAEARAEQVAGQAAFVGVDLLEAEAEIEQMRAALERIAHGDHLSDWVRDIAVAALASTPKEPEPTIYPDTWSKGPAQ